jgi:senataxin
MAPSYLSNYPLAIRNNFFGAIDKWQAALILTALERDQPAYGAQRGVLDLSLPYLQLLFNEPSLLSPTLSEGKLSTGIDEVIASHPNDPSAAASLGLTPTLIALLTSPDAKRRQWAHKQVGFITRAVPFDEWTENGTGTEVQTLYLSSFPGDVSEQWAALKALITLDCLTLETIQRGLLEGQYDVAAAPRHDKSIMTFVSRLLGSSSSCKSALSAAIANMHSFPQCL